MVVLFWYLLKSDLSSVRYSTHVHWASHSLQGIRKTRPCLTGHSVLTGPGLGYYAGRGEQDQDDLRRLLYDRRAAVRPRQAGSIHRGRF